MQYYAVLLKLNFEKTEGMWLGSLKNCNLNMYKGIKFNDTPIKCLGLFVGHDKLQCEQLNWNKKLDMFEKTLLQWKRQNLSFLVKLL